MQEEMQGSIVMIRFQQNGDETFTSSRIPDYISPALAGALETICCSVCGGVDALRLLGAEDAQTLLSSGSGAVKQLAATEYPASYDRGSRTITISHTPAMKLGFDLNGEAEIALDSRGVMLYACGKPYSY